MWHEKEILAQLVIAKCPLVLAGSSLSEDAVQLSRPVKAEVGIQTGDPYLGKAFGFVHGVLSSPLSGPPIYDRPSNPPEFDPVVERSTTRSVGRGWVAHPCRHN